MIVWKNDRDRSWTCKILVRFFKIKFRIEKIIWKCVKLCSIYCNDISIFSSVNITYNGVFFLWNGASDRFCHSVLNVVTHYRVVMTIHCTLLSVFDLECIIWKFEPHMYIVKISLVWWHRHSVVYLCCVKPLEILSRNHIFLNQSDNLFQIIL